ncbi:MAG: DIP1984 family protein [Erysipelotrichaceae bacterium]|nr:DIP1984 family protein [Erysipelotrichaceae bacterium]
MILAEALQQRADLNKMIAQLESRMINNATVQEGEKCVEDPKDLLKQYDECISQLEELTSKINITNTKTVVNGKSLTEMMSKRDCLKMKISALQNLASSASNVGNRYSRTEIKILPAVNVKDLQKQIDSLSKELRLLDNTIQSTNWNTELI